jgi:hypothetical protein
MSAPPTKARSQFRVLAEPRHRMGELGQQVGPQRVQSRGVVDHDRRDAAAVAA